MSGSGVRPDGRGVHQAWPGGLATRGVTNAGSRAVTPQVLYAGVLGAWLGLLVIGELAVALLDPILVFPVHGSLVALAGTLLVIAYDQPSSDSLGTGATVIAVVLILAPLARIVGLALPTAVEPSLAWAVVGIPFLLGALLAARAAGFGLAGIGLTWREPGWQVAIILVSAVVGVAAFALLRPAPLGPLPWTLDGIVPALSTAIFGGVAQELIFRGAMQTAARPILGRWSWLYASAILAGLHLAFGSYIGVAIVLTVGLLYGWVFERTGSTIGISIGHAVAVVLLFHVVPNLVDPADLPAAALLPVPGGLVVPVAIAVLIGVLLVGGLMVWRRREAVDEEAAWEETPVNLVDRDGPPDSGAGPDPGAAPDPDDDDDPDRIEALAGGPLTLVVVAQPFPPAGRTPLVVHADRLSVPLTALRRFQATELETISAHARGNVRFTSEYPDRQVIVPAGTKLTTRAGIAFRTMEAVVLARPAAGRYTTQHDVPVEALEAGPAANVKSGAIDIPPPALRAALVSVENPRPTAGGEQAEIRRVGQADYEAALAAAAEQLSAALDRGVAGLRPERHALSAGAEFEASVAEPAAAEVVGGRADWVDLTVRVTARLTAVRILDLEQAITDQLAGLDPPRPAVPGSLAARVIGATTRGDSVVYTVEVRARPIDGASAWAGEAIPNPPDSDPGFAPFDLFVEAGPAPGTDAARRTRRPATPPWVRR